MPSIRSLARLCAATLALALGTSHAIGITDPVNDYVPGYTGSKAGDLDVVGAFVTYNPATDMFVFSGTMASAIGTTPGGFYVWGVDRGAGTANFAANGIGGVLFDSVVILRPNGTATVNRLSGNGVGAVTLPSTTAASFDSTIIGKISGSLLPSNGFAKSAYTWNLWPRDGNLPTGFGQISDFAPNNSNIASITITPVPEPDAALMLLIGLAGVAGFARRARRA